MTQLSRQTDAVLSLREARTPSLLADVCTMTKVRITAMVAVTAYVGYSMGLAMPGAIEGWMVVAATLLGTSLACMGASVLNQVCEIDTDKLMERTRNRPLPTGRISPLSGALLGVGLSLAGVGLLAAFTTWLAAGLAAFTIVSYVTIYTPMKRLHHVSTIIGAVPGALPPVIGYAAATGQITAEPMAVFAIMFLWQLPHFLAIAWLYREDYARGGFPMLPVIDPTGRSTFRQILIGSMALIPLGLLPALIGMTGLVYFVGSLAAGLILFVFSVRLVRHQTRSAARQLFFATLIYLPALLILLILLVADGK